MKFPVKRAGLWTLGGVVVGCGVWLAVGAWSAARIRAALGEGARAGLPGRTDAIDEFLDARFGPVASADNAAPLLEAAAATIEDVTFPARPEDGGLPTVDDTLRAAVAHAAPAYALLEQASARARCRYTRRWEDGYAVRLPEIQGTLQIRAALVARAALRLGDGAAPEAAAEDARLLVFLMNSLREQPTLISQVLRVALASDADRVRRALAARTGSPDPVPGGVTVRGAIAFGFHGEHALLGSAAAGRLWHSGGIGEPSVLQRLAWPFQRGAAADVLGAWADVAAHGDESYPALIARCARADEPGASTRLFRIEAEKLVRREAEEETRRAVTDAGVRVLAWRRANGRWPATLDEAGAASADPRTETPLTLRAEGAGVVVGPADGVAAWTIPAPR